MTTNKSLTVIRNAKVVGNNRKSYNDKHPENPVSLRPIFKGLQDLNEKFHKRVRALHTMDKPIITGYIAYFRSLPA
jgi:hypothetical protein